MEENTTNNEISEDVGSTVDDWSDVDVSDVIGSAEGDKETETTENKEVVTPNENENKVEENTEITTPEFELEITVNGQKETLNKEQATALAQKGKDYDRIRPIYDFVKGLADDEGKSVEDYVKTTSDNLKDYKIKQLAEEKGISEDIAKELYESRAQQKKTLASEKIKQEKSQEEAKQTAELEDFLKTYPNVDAKSIPQSVWKKASEGTPLKYAYMEYEMQQVKNENSILKTNVKNKEQEITTGNNTVNQKVKDEFELAWEEALNS